ncbi:MqnA/MqnD/SBP family protein [Poseidonibacter lekithochrous]|uniref:MqnA/MqnD/SBP family protein n=1 Tax=Poseidonibacter lekithochrous TaxID=1904463 RepID=UPI0008FC746C|nr:MqnA/MqnD/SBP family protein [Poseidonibacter lekithochrous]QKJ24160.1 6-amino-6-deoxyfutalosine synthase [Poseidonibacter lekithochrous]
MIFAKIDFINLLPFHIYIKKNIPSSQMKSIIEYKKSYPSNINKKYKKRKVDSAFISSIASRNEKNLDFGIIAQKDVLSVLVIPGNEQDDFQSETSNALAKVLGYKGQVLIGDKALKYYHANKNSDFIDLAQAWNDKYNLPFVFAVLCYSSNKMLLDKYTRKFNKRHIKIPQYILEQYSKRTGISKQNILDYLKKIDYDLGIKEKRALKLFLKLTKEKGL